MFVISNRDISDDDLMAHAGKGDEEAFVTLYNRYKDFVFRLILFRCGGDRALTEDLAQNVWMKLFKLPNYQEKGTFKSWLGTLCKNEVIDYFCKHRPIVNGHPPCPGPDPPIEPVYLKKFFNCLKKLPSEQKDAFLLYLSEMTIAEIAKTTQVSLEAAKTRVRYAREKLKKCLGNELTKGGNDE